jgi:uncharacterized membrane protein
MIAVSFEETTTMTYGAGYPATEDRALPAVVYAFYVLGLFHGVTLLIGLIMAYVLRSGAGPVNGSHYTYLIRTFWISLIWAVIGGGIMLVSIPFTFILIGIPVMMLGGAICAGAWIWAIIRCIAGAVRLADGAPIAQPYGFRF